MITQNGQIGSKRLQLVDNLSTLVLAQHDVELRFRALAGKGDPAQGLRLLDKLDEDFAGKAAGK